jgi:hypothetical protein
MTTISSSDIRIIGFAKFVRVLRNEDQESLRKHRRIRRVTELTSWLECRWLHSSRGVFLNAMLVTVYSALS